MANKRKSGSISEADTSLLECPVCMSSPILPPIRQCVNGHLLCDSCSAKLSLCPTCRAGQVNIRNLIAEKMAADMEFQCPHAPECRERVKYGKLTEHVAACDFRPFACPHLEPCAQIGFKMNPEAIVQHLRDTHGATTKHVNLQSVDEACMQWKINNPTGLKRAVWAPAICHAFGEYFVCFCRSGLLDGWVHYATWMQHVGPATSASRFTYEVSAKGQGLTFLFGGQPGPVNHSATQVLESKQCLFIDFGVAHDMSSKPGDEKGLDLKLEFVIRRR
mmetsp:Transcript_66984/g.143242  ORF Transcript_66984/g.143242 Transcript_66984/m.143242 type:complete len:276 (-) Transcript_66984:188-1015(-)